MAEMEEEVLSSGISLELLDTSLSYTFPHSVSPSLTLFVTQPYAKLPSYQLFDKIKQKKSLCIMPINENDPHNKITDLMHLTEFIQIFKMTIFNTFE